MSLRSRCLSLSCLRTHVSPTGLSAKRPRRDGLGSAVWIVCLLVFRRCARVSFGVAMLLAIERRTELATHLVVGSSLLRLAHGISLPRHRHASCQHADVSRRECVAREHRGRSLRWGFPLVPELSRR